MTEFATERPSFFQNLRRNTLVRDATEFLVDLVDGRLGVTREEAEAWAEEQFQLGREGAFFSCNLRYCNMAVRMESGG